MKRVLTLWFASALCFASAQVHAQAAPAPAAAATAPAAATPSTTAAPAAAAAPTTAPAVAAPAAAEAQPAATPAATPAPSEAATAPAAPSAQDEQARLQKEAERARLRLLIARAQADRQKRQALASQPAEQAEPEAHGDAGAPFAVALSIEMPWITDVGFDLFSDDDVATRLGVWATYDLLSIGDAVFLAAGLGLDIESAEQSGLLGGALDTELTSVSSYATAVARYVPVAWLQPHLRVSGGVQSVTTHVDYGELRARDEDGSPYASFGAGFTLRSPTRLFESKTGSFASLSFGIMVEGGYSLVAPLQVTLDGEGPVEHDIALAEAELGELDRSGPFMRISFVARF